MTECKPLEWLITMPAAIICCPPKPHPRLPLAPVHSGNSLRDYGYESHKLRKRDPNSSKPFKGSIECLFIMTQTQSANFRGIPLFQTTKWDGKRNNSSLVVCCCCFVVVVVLLLLLLLSCCFPVQCLEEFWHDNYGHSCFRFKKRKKTWLLVLPTLRRLDL